MIKLFFFLSGKFMAVFFLASQGCLRTFCKHFTFRCTKSIKRFATTAKTVECIQYK